MKEGWIKSHTGMTHGFQWEDGSPLTDPTIGLYLTGAVSRHDTFAVIDADGHRIQLDIPGIGVDFDTEDDQLNAAKSVVRSVLETLKTELKKVGIDFQPVDPLPGNATYDKNIPTVLS